MKIKYPLAFLTLILLCTVALSAPLKALEDNQPVFKAEVGSAIYFKVVELMLFQYGPSLAINMRLDHATSIGLQVEHVYWEAQSHLKHIGQRSVLINLQWIRYYAKAFLGVEYIISPSKEYDKNPATRVITEKNSVGLIGLGTFLSFTENALTLRAQGKFTNTDQFRTDAGIISLFAFSATMRMLPWVSLSCEFRWWYNTAFYHDKMNIPEDHIVTNERGQWSIFPSLQAGLKGFLFTFGPVFSLERPLSYYENQFVLYGTLSYAHSKRN